MLSRRNQAGADWLLPLLTVAVAVIFSLPPAERPHWSRPPSWGSASMGSEYAWASGSSCCAAGRPVCGSSCFKHALQSVAVPGCVHENAVLIVMLGRLT